MKKIIIAILATTALILTAAFLFGSFAFGNVVYYYTRIDNTKYTNFQNGGETYYSYTLPSRCPDDGESELNFNTVRELRDGAFLKLKVSRVMGVLDWEEVKWSDIPETVRNFFPQLDNA